MNFFKIGFKTLNFIDEYMKKMKTNERNKMKKWRKKIVILFSAHHLSIYPQMCQLSVSRVPKKAHRFFFVKLTAIFNVMIKVTNGLQNRGIFYVFSWVKDQNDTKL
jgi:hypothetical protein